MSKAVNFSFEALFDVVAQNYNGPDLEDFIDSKLKEMPSLMIRKITKSLTGLPCTPADLYKQPGYEEALTAYVEAHNQDDVISDEVISSKIDDESHHTPELDEIQQLLDDDEKSEEPRTPPVPVIAKPVKVRAPVKKVVKPVKRINFIEFNGVPYVPTVEMPKTTAFVETYNKILNEEMDHLDENIKRYIDGSAKMVQAKYNSFIAELEEYSLEIKEIVPSSKCYYLTIEIKTDDTSCVIEHIKYQNDELKTAYDEMIKEHKSDLIKKLPIESMLGTDAVYHYKGKVLTNNIPLIFYNKELNSTITGGEYKNIYIKDNDEEFKNATAAYIKLINEIKYEAAEINITQIKKLMNTCYANRAGILFHPSVADKLDNWWETAKTKINEITEQTEIVKKWISVLDSEQCKNILIHNYPECTKFKNFILSLAKEKESIKLFNNELYSISFVFGPFCCRFDKFVEPKKYTKAGCSRLMADSLTISIKDIMENYDMCIYCYALINDVKFEDHAYKYGKLILELLVEEFDKKSKKSE